MDYNDENVSNIILTGTWKVHNYRNSSLKLPKFEKTSGNAVVELISSPSKITGVHYVQVELKTCTLLRMKSRKDLDFNDFELNIGRGLTIRWNTHRRK